MKHMNEIIVWKRYLLCSCEVSVTFTVFVVIVEASNPTISN